MGPKTACQSLAGRNPERQFLVLIRCVIISLSEPQNESVMKNPIKQRRKAVVCLLFCLVLAQIENAGAAAASELPSRAEIRSQLKELSPGDREAKIRGWREEYGSVGSTYGAGRDRMGGMSQEARERMARFQREIQKLPPEEREARISEMRRRYSGMPAGAREQPQEIDLSRLSPAKRIEFLKLRRALSGVSAEERRSKINEFLLKAGLDPGKSPGSSVGGTRRPSPNDMSDDERRQRFQQMREQAWERIAVLEKKAADGTISEREEKALERMKQVGQGRRPGIDSQNPRPRRP
jgi:hypothetical protein